MFCHLIIHNVHSDFESLFLKLFELLLVCFVDNDVGESGDRCGEDTVGFIVVHDEIADAPVQRDKWEVAGHVIVHDSGSLVGESSKAKYICDRCITVVRDDILIPAVG